MVCLSCFLDSFTYLSLAYILYRLFHTIYAIVYPYLLATPLDLHKLAGGAKWAVVTGSTDGIGKEYAFQLARKGFNILLISRTQAKLDSVKEEIKKECKNAEVETVAYNFTNANVDDYKKQIISVIEKKDVGILVNNVGLSYAVPNILHKIDIKENTDIAIVNMIPVSILTAAVLPQMVARHSGVIVNVSSGAAYIKCPEVATYSSSKAYINHFSSILRNEYANSGITIQTLCPAYVSTNMSKVKVSLFALSTSAYVESAIRTIGIVDETTGCIQHQIQTIAFGLPEPLMIYFAKLELEKTKSAINEREKAAKQQ
uniref:Steroid dehydrogenase n=1 Tax=Panagrolaimus sp. ES5 TaxID=591445 RepID=A0AC34F689_9BILA